MKKKSAVLFVSVILNLCFSSLFLLFFLQFQKQPEATVYMHQVGIFKEDENAIQLTNTMTSQGIPVFSYKNEDLIIVVCNLSLSSEELESKEALLAEQNISYIEKEVSSSSAAFKKAVSEKDLNKIMELMNH